MWIEVDSNFVKVTTSASAGIACAAAAATEAPCCSCTSARIASSYSSSALRWLSVSSLITRIEISDNKEEYLILHRQRLFQQRIRCAGCGSSHDCTTYMMP